MNMQMQEMAEQSVKALTLDQIERWAKTKEETEIVGYTSEPRWCPVAEYLQATVPQRVDGSRVYWVVGMYWETGQNNVVLVQAPMPPSSYDTLVLDLPRGYDTVVLDMPPGIETLVGQIDNLGEGGNPSPVDAQQLLRVIAGVRGEG